MFEFRFNVIHQPSKLYSLLGFAKRVEISGKWLDVCNDSNTYYAFGGGINRLTFFQRYSFIRSLRGYFKYYYTSHESFVASWWPYKLNSKSTIISFCYDPYIIGVVKESREITTYDGSAKLVLLDNRGDISDPQKNILYGVGIILTGGFEHTLFSYNDRLWVYGDCKEITSSNNLVLYDITGYTHSYISKNNYKPQWLIGRLEEFNSFVKQFEGLFWNAS